MIRSNEPLDSLSADNVGFDNLINIAGCHAPVPDCVWIDNDVGTMFALIEAAGLICPHFPFKSQSCKLLLEQFL